MLPLHPALLSQPDYLFSQIAAAAEESESAILTAVSFPSASGM